MGDPTEHGTFSEDAWFREEWVIEPCESTQTMDTLQRHVASMQQPDHLKLFSPLLQSTEHDQRSIIASLNRLQESLQRVQCTATEIPHPLHVGEHMQQSLDMLPLQAIEDIQVVAENMSAASGLPASPAIESNQIVDQRIFADSQGMPTAMAGIQLLQSTAAKANVNHVRENMQQSLDVLPLLAIEDIQGVAENMSAASALPASPVIKSNPFVAQSIAADNQGLPTAMAGIQLLQNTAAKTNTACLPPSFAIESNHIGVQSISTDSQEMPTAMARIQLLQSIAAKANVNPIPSSSPPSPPCPHPSPSRPPPHPTRGAVPPHLLQNSCSKKQYQNPPANTAQQPSVTPPLLQNIAPTTISDPYVAQCNANPPVLSCQVLPPPPFPSLLVLHTAGSQCTRFRALRQV